MKTLILFILLLLLCSTFAQAQQNLPTANVIPVPFLTSTQSPSNTTSSSIFPWPTQPNGVPYPQITFGYTGVSATTINPAITVLQCDTVAGPAVASAQPNVVNTVSVTTTTDRKALANLPYSPFIQVKSVNPSGTTTISNFKTCFFVEGHN